MNKEQTKEAIKVMQAWVDGKQIQFSIMGNDDWGDCLDPAWRFKDGQYRIKPELARYRRSLWQDITGFKYVAVATTEKQVAQFEQATGLFIRWIDTEWQEEIV